MCMLIATTITWEPKHKAPNPQKILNSAGHSDLSAQVAGGLSTVCGPILTSYPENVLQEHQVPPGPEKLLVFIL